MSSNTKYSVSAILALVVVGGLFIYFGKSSPKAPLDVVSTTSTTTPSQVTSSSTPVAPTPPKATSPGVNTTGYHSYSNAEYHFSIYYPPYVQVRNTFSTFHQIGTNWRLNAGQANQGKGLIELSIFSIDQGSISDGKQKYPLFFQSLVRVGVSPNVKECYTPDEGYANQTITTETINGTVFKKFSSQDAGMMKYVQSESYRTIHNNMCFVLEQIKNGSSYRDEKMATGIAESTLSSYYTTGATIIKTFRFLK